jgi:DnaJ-domain-containing protein 1
LADALKDARWPDAHELLKQIDSAVDQLLDSAPGDSTMPESLDDAYRILNVSEQTPLQNIKAVVNAYGRVWHPDLAHDKIESHQFKLKMQQINVAWDIIQKALRIADSG